MTQRDKWLVTTALLVAFLLIPFKVHKHRVPEKNFIAALSLPAPLSPYDSLIRMYADSIGWDWRLIAAVIRQESNFNSQIISEGGNVGLMQIHPGRYSLGTLLDPKQNIRIGTLYLHKLEQLFSARSAEDTLKFVLSAYNMGDGKLRKFRADAREKGKDARKWDEVLPLNHQTRRYVNSILRHYDFYLFTQPSAVRLRVLSDTIPKN